MEHFSYKTGVVDVDIRISSHLKEELAWVADKWLQVICYLKTIMVCTKKPKGTKAILNFKKCYVGLSNVF